MTATKATAKASQGGPKGSINLQGIRKVKKYKPNRQSNKQQ
jgi:hypothetical protein